MFWGCDDPVRRSPDGGGLAAEKGGEMISRRGFLAVAGAGAVVSIAGVTGIQLLPGESKATGDPVIRYGQENCARCRMTISDVRFASAWREPSGKEVHFDDIGCMVLRRGEQTPAETTRFWVHDYSTEAWLDAPTAAYAVSEAIRTPMSHGVAASATPEGARRIVKDSNHVQITRWEGLAPSLERRG